MHPWEYLIISLNDLPFKTRAIDLLNDAGKNRWELVAITGNNMAYLKRLIARPATRSTSAPASATVR